MSPAVLLVTLLLVLPAGAAQAATVSAGSAGPCDRSGCAPPVILVLAEPGERNDVVVEPNGVVRDTQSVLRAGERCEAVDAHTVRCPPGIVRVALGDEDDSARGLASNVDGGPGDDTIADASEAIGGEGDDTIVGAYAKGGPGADRLSAGDRLRADLQGEDGDDVLTGGAGTDELDGGPGRDTVAGGEGDDLVDDFDTEPGADRLDGGPGSDFLVAWGRAAPIAIDLSTQTSSDGDALTGFENAAGGAGADDLRGDDGPNRLAGGGGEDRLDGGPGADRLEGGSGFDHLAAGDGDDRVDARGTGFGVGGLAFVGLGLDAEPEPISCGTGVDVVEDLAGDLVAADCEAVGALAIAPFPQSLGRRGIALRVPCPASLLSGRRCRGTVRSATVHGSPLARRRFAVRRGGARVVLPPSFTPTDGLALAVTYRRGLTTRWIAAPAR